MRPLIDCPHCACLIDTRESACPFCGTVVRRTEGWSVLGLGFMIGLATAACGDKSGTTDSTSTGPGESSTSSSSGTEADGTTTGTTDGETMADSMVPTTSFPGTSAYAGPDTNDSLPDDTGTTATDTGTETGTSTTGTSTTGTSTTGTGTETGSSTDFPGTSAYAGPDTGDT